MKLFLDTEFTDLVPGNKLISIALVDENGEYFYAELNDTYELKDCSDFVKSFVLPFLKGGAYVMSEKDCALQMANWIEDRGTDCILACDNISWDLPHIQKLINKIGVPPSNINMQDYAKFTIMNDDIERIVLENDFDIHNALDDAKVMSIAHSLGQAWEY